jgi:DNA polymerase-3 subunit beta
VTQKQFRSLLAQTQLRDGGTGRSLLSERLLLLLADGNELRAVATDGHRLAYASMLAGGCDAEGGVPRQELILPRKTVIELNRLLPTATSRWQIECCRNQIRFQFGHINLVSKLIDGRSRITSESFRRR